MKRCIAFCLALGAAISLTACGGGDTEGGLLCKASGIRPDTVLLSVDGRDVSAQRYLYWLAYACDYIADYYDSGEGIQWGDTVSGQSLEDYAKDQALQNAALYATVETWAEDYGCTLTDEDRTAMDREWAARAAQFGGRWLWAVVVAAAAVVLWRRGCRLRGKGLFAAGLLLASAGYVALIDKAAPFEADRYYVVIYAAEVLAVAVVLARLAPQHETLLLLALVPILAAHRTDPNAYLYEDAAPRKAALADTERLPAVELNKAGYEVAPDLI